MTPYGMGRSEVSGDFCQRFVQSERSFFIQLLRLARVGVV